jgi:hypothetical protein
LENTSETNNYQLFASQEKVRKIQNSQKGGFPWVVIPRGVYALKSSVSQIQKTPMKPGFHIMGIWDRVEVCEILNSPLSI